MIYRHLTEILEIARRQESRKLVVAAAGACATGSFSRPGRKHH